MTNNELVLEKQLDIIEDKIFDLAFCPQHIEDIVYEITNGLSFNRLSKHQAAHLIAVLQALKELNDAE